MRTLLVLVAGALAGCSNLAVVLPRASLGEPPLRSPEEAGPRQTRIARSLTTFRLQNGLEVALLEDGRRPSFALSLWFPVFARGESDGPPGLVAAASLEPLCRTRAGDALEERFARGVVLEAGAGAEHGKLLATGPAGELEALLVELARRLSPATCPAPASLVVAGDLDPQLARGWVERSFGALPTREPAPPEARAWPDLPAEPVVTRHAGEGAEWTLLWRAPAELAPGAAELELLATLLAEGPAARLEERLVLDTRLAREVAAGRLASALGPVFHVTAAAAHESDLPALRRETLAVLTELAEDGPRAEELARARARAEARFLARMESLLARAEAVQGYLRAFGQADGFQLDLERWTAATPESVRAAACRLLESPWAEFRRLSPEAPLTESAACGAPPPSRTTGCAHPAPPDAL